MGLPLTPKIHENGVRDLVNDMESGSIYIDKVGLEEIIEYHIAAYKIIIDGYYYDQGKIIILTMLLKICLI